MKLYKSLTQSLNFAADDSAISNHLEQAALEEEVERLALDDESSDDGLGGSNEDDSEKKRAKNGQKLPLFPKLPLPQNNSELALLPFPSP